MIIFMLLVTVAFIFATLICHISCYMAAKVDVLNENSYYENYKILKVKI